MQQNFPPLPKVEWRREFQQKCSVWQSVDQQLVVVGMAMEQVLPNIVYTIDITVTDTSYIPEVILTMMIGMRTTIQHTMKSNSATERLMRNFVI